jgi:drug/metabolite transporter (DMT)-like permease
VTEMWAVGLILVAAFMGSFGSVYLKKGANNLHRNPLLILKNWDLLKGFAIYGPSTILYVIGIRGGELSVLFPMVSTGYVWTCFLSVKMLGERMNTIKWAGITLIILGVSLIGMGS